MTESNDSEHERFEIRRRIGGGVLGEVFEAYDRQRGEMVALKTLRRPSPASLDKLRGEFCALAAISHPNLVPLYEIHVGEESSFYTMELVEGESLKDYVLSSPESAEAPEETPPVDGARLRSALLQLALGVKAVHDAGKLHGDLKPSNLLVTPHGGLVILDFGVAAELIFSPARSFDSGFAGTAAYMAPEQARGEPAQPASDWYAVGVILFEVLTGRWPFVGSLARILIDKQFMTAPSPADLTNGLPADLVELCRCLLETDPANRPTGSEVVRRLGGTEADLILKSAGEGRFVGRLSQLAALDDAFALTQAGHTVSVCIHGRSGIGKTALVNAFLQRVRRRTQAVLLTGRCHPFETVPFKAFEGVVDSLSRFLRHLTKNLVEELLPPRTDLLARLFPALLRLDAVAHATEAGSEAEPWEGEEHDRSTLRRLALGALRRLLARIAAIHPVILHVDDLQWGDADSAVLLRDLLKTPDAPPLLLLVSFRSEEVDTRPFLQELLAQTGSTTSRQLVVGTLSDQESQELARLVLGPKGDAEDLAEKVVAGAHGSPFLIEQLSRYALTEGSDLRAGIRIADVLRHHLERIGKGSRRLLRILAAAGKPLTWTLACRAAKVTEERQHLESALNGALLIRSFGGDGLVELFHDRLREVLVQEMNDDELRNVHARLAAVLEDDGHEDPGTLMEHYAQAGDNVKAGRLAQQAAARCSTALAFAQAARLYHQALELGHVEEVERLGLLHGLADSLALAGKTLEAAELHLELAEMTRGRPSQEHRRRSAMEYLMAGNVDRGLELARDVLRSVGLEMPPDRRSSLNSLRWHRFHLWLRRYRFRRQDAAQIPARRLLRIDTCWAIASGLETVDVLRAADFQSRHLLLALEAGEERRVARALAMEVGMRSAAGSRARRRSNRRRQRAHKLAAEIGDTYAEALATLQDGVTLFLDGAWRVASETCDRAEAMFGECYEGTVWEVTTARRFSLAALVHLGELGEVSRRLPGYLREAVEQGNVGGSHQLRTRLSIFWLAADDPDEARRQSDEAARSWVQSGFHLPHWDLVAARTETDLYTGHGVDALAAMDERLPALGKALLRIQPVRVEAVLLMARGCLAAALQDRSRQAELQQRAIRGARRLEREGVPHALPLATLLRAAVAQLVGDAPGARDALERAAFGFESVGMRLHSTAAWRRLGELLGGTAGQELVHRSDVWMKEQKVRDPARMAAMLAPGFAL